MSVNRNGCHVTVLVGFLFLMLATAVATKIKVNLDNNFNKVVGGQRAVWKCKCCSTRYLNGTVNNILAKPTTPVTAKTKITDFRIPTDLYPLHYEVELFPNMTDPDPKNFTFKGYVKIWLLCEKKTDKLTLHMKGLTVDPNSIIFTGGPSVVSHHEDKDREFLILQLDTNTTKGQNYSVEMNFTSPLKDDLTGLYLSHYTRSNTTVYLATSQFQPHHARRAFPCFDEPAIKATFDITLVRPDNYISLSNMPVQASEQIQIDSVNFVKDKFMTTKKMSTYLLAFVVCDFVKIENTTENGVLFRVWSRADVFNQTKYSFDVGLKVIPFFEQFFNVTYPLPKLDMIAIPHMEFGGMENWGLIINRESSMITKEKENWLAAILTIHEIAHQWFGDLVSPAWWDAIWLNEGFASFLEALGTDYYHPEWKTFESFVLHSHLSVFPMDSLVSSHPIYISEVNPSELSAIFDMLTYFKSSAIIRMMRHFIGFETFTKGLSLYLTRHQYAAATQDDLWSALTEQARLEDKNIDVKEVMDTWTLQMNFPLVTVSRDDSHIGAFRVKQERFLLNPNAKEIGRYISPFNYTWNIPLTFASNKTRNFNESDIPIYWLWRNENNKLINESELLPSEDTWFICNINMNGYYMVNYDISNWLALARQLKEDHEVIPVINRVQIINDAWTLAKKSILSYEIAFNIIDYLENERSYLPWKQVSIELNNIGIMLSVSPIYGEFQKFMRKKYNDPYRYLEEKKKTTNLTKSEKDLHLVMVEQACKYGIPECGDNAVAQFKRWMDDPSNATLENEKLVYCEAISKGDDKEWDFLFEMFKTEKVRQGDALYGLSCTKLPWLINRYLQLSIDENTPVPKHLAIWIPTHASEHTASRDLSWDFFRANFKKINQIYGTTLSWTRMIDLITKSLNTELRLKELKAFVHEQDGQFGSGEGAIQQAIQKVESNVQWIKFNYRTVEAWLKANVN